MLKERLDTIYSFVILSLTLTYEDITGLNTLILITDKNEKITPALKI